MYEYLIGDLILGILWLFCFLLRKDLRKPMIWSGAAYAALMTIIFIILKVISLFVIIENYRTFNPGYWSPNTLFDLNRITGGHSIEDALFMFFTGGIVAFIYEFFFHKKIKLKINHKYQVKALIFSFIISVIFAAFYKINLIYPLILFGFAGALFIWFNRKDLIKHSLLGGIIFLVIYFIFFSLTNLLFPNFIEQTYNLNNISGILLFKIPLEEFLFALSFGLLWSPFYEYEHGEKVVDL